MLAAEAAIASAALLARLGLHGGLSAPALAAWRLAVASVVVVGLGALRRSQQRQLVRRLSIRSSLKLGMAGVLLGVHFAAWFASLQTVPVARSTLLVSTTPLWTGLAATVILRQRLPYLFWLGLALSLAGVWLVTGGLAASPPGLGDALAVLGAMAIGGYLLLVQDDQSRLGTGRVVAWTYAVAALSMALFVALSANGQSAMPHTRAAWLSILGMAAGPQLIGHTALNWSLQRFHAGAVAAATLLEPVFAAALAWWLLGERIGGVQAAGGALLLAGVGFALWRPGRSAAG